MKNSRPVFAWGNKASRDTVGSPDNFVMHEKGYKINFKPLIELWVP